MTTVVKPVKRETVISYRGRPLVVTLHDRFIEIGQKGCRDTVTLHYTDLFELALKVRANNNRRQA